MKLKICFLALLLILLLVSCGKTKTVPSLTADQPQGASGDGISLAVRFPTCAPDCESVSLILTNGSGKRVEYGSAWMLEREENGNWRTVPFIEDFGFTSELILLEDGGSWSQKCLLRYFTSALTEGRYRIAKKIGGAFYYAEFVLDGNAPVTAASPFGLKPLESLPKEYTAEEAVSDGVVLLEQDGTVRGAEAVLGFFESVRIPHLSAMLRGGYFTMEGDLILEDLLWDGEKLCRTRDTSRDRFDAGEGSVIYYSTFAEDGTSVYPSNSAAVSVNCPWIPGFYASESYTPDPRIPEIVRSLYGRELKVYSADGLRSAGAILDEPLSYALNIKEPNGGESGMMLSVSKERTKDDPDARIVDFAWEGNTLMVMVQLGESWYYYEFVDSDTKEVLSYTGSQHPYEIRDGEILIME